MDIYFVMLHITGKPVYLPFYWYLICYDCFAGAGVGWVNCKQCQKLKVAKFDRSVKKVVCCVLCPISPQFSHPVHVAVKQSQQTRYQKTNKQAFTWYQTWILIHLNKRFVWWIQVVVQFCNIWLLTLPPISPPCTSFSAAIKTDKVPVERQFNRLTHDTSHDKYKSMIKEI